jgi:hypothetical protein
MDSGFRGSDGFMTSYKFVNIDVPRHGRIPINVLVALRTHLEIIGTSDLF